MDMWNGKTLKTSTKSYMYAIITIFMWGTMAPVVKSLLYNMSDMQALAVGSVFAFVFLGIVNFISGNYKLMKEYKAKDYLIMAGLGFLGIFLYSALYYYGISVLSSQEACILNYLWPMMIVIFACILLKEKFTLKKMLAMGLSFSGIVVITLGSDGGSGDSKLSGIISCVLAAVCYGLYSVLNKKRGYNQNIAMMITWLVTGICSFAACILQQDWVVIEGSQWPGLIWLGIGTNATAYLLWALALQGAEETAGIANLAYLTPFISVMISTVVFHEPLKWTAILALVLIISGIVVQSGKKAVT